MRRARPQGMRRQPQRIAEIDGAEISWCPPGTVAKACRLGGTFRRMQAGFCHTRTAGATAPQASRPSPLRNNAYGNHRSAMGAAIHAEGSLPCALKFSENPDSVILLMNHGGYIRTKVNSGRSGRTCRSNFAPRQAARSASVARTLQKLLARFRIAERIERAITIAEQLLGNVSS